MRAVVLSRDNELVLAELGDPPDFAPQAVCEMLFLATAGDRRHDHIHAGVLPISSSS
jgi:hypothetical protein